MSLKSYGVNGGAVQEEAKSKDILLQMDSSRCPQAQACNCRALGYSFGGYPYMLRNL